MILQMQYAFLCAYVLTGNIRARELPDYVEERKPLAKTFRMVILREMKKKLNQDESHRVGSRYPKLPYYIFTSYFTS